MDSLRSEGAVLTYPQLQSLLRIEFARARRYHYALSCLILAVDRIEHLADIYGANARQEILLSLIKLIRLHTRSSDAVGMSSDRIILVLPHTDEEGALTLAQRVHGQTAELRFRIGGKDLSVTLSVGLATCADRGHIFYDSLLKNAEQALTTVVEKGGNGVLLYSGPSPRFDASPQSA